MELESRTTTFRDYFRVIYRYKIVFILLLAIVMPITYYDLELKTPMYEASVMMMIKAQKDTEATYYKGVSLGKSLSMDLATIVKSHIVFERVVEALKLYEYPPDYEKKFATPLKAARIERRMNNMEQRQKKLTPEQEKLMRFDMAMGWLDSAVFTVPSEDSSIFQIVVRDYDPQRTLLVANSVSRSYVIFDLEQQVAELRLKYGDKHSEVLQLKNYIEEFSKTLDGKLIPDIEALGPASIKIIQQARYATPLQTGSKQRILVIMLFICLLISVVIAFGLEFLNQTIRTPSDIETELALPCLGSIAQRKSKNKLLPGAGSSSNTEYFRSLHMVADRIYLSMKESNLKSLLISDIDGSKDSAGVIADLGFYLSDKQGLKVLIIDANLRRDYFNEVFDVSADSYGLRDMIEGNSDFTDAVIELSPQFHIITSGTAVANPMSFLQSHQIADVIAEARKNYDIVLVNSAEMRHYGDSVLLSDSVDGFALILSEGKTKSIIVKNAISPLMQKKTVIVGVILNNRKYVLPKLIYKFT